jgi:hypothetical protein
MKSKYGVGISTDVKLLVKELKEEYELSDGEALTIALKAEQNQMFKQAFVISANDDTPTALEAIAIGLGYSKIGR